MKAARGKTRARGRKTVQSSSRRSVQHPELPIDCTDSSIDENVQRGAVEVQVQVFRAKMKQYLEGEAVVILGNTWHCRGFVIPVTKTSYRTEEDRKQHHAKMRAQFEDVLEKLHH